MNFCSKMHNLYSGQEGHLRLLLVSRNGRSSLAGCWKNAGKAAPWQQLRQLKFIHGQECLDDLGCAHWLGESTHPDWWLRYFNYPFHSIQPIYRFSEGNMMCPHTSRLSGVTCYVAPCFSPAFLSTAPYLHLWDTAALNRSAGSASTQRPWMMLPGGSPFQDIPRHMALICPYGNGSSMQKHPFFSRSLIRRDENRTYGWNNHAAFFNRLCNTLPTLALHQTDTGMVKHGTSTSCSFCW